MKLLHTGDWHVGKALKGRSRADDHEAVLAEIAEIALGEKVDLILVAGDLFDTLAPSPEAERIVYSALLELSNIARVVVIPGNHDNERRMAAVRSLFDLANVTIRANVADDDAQPLMVETASGEVARIALLPWLSQRYVTKSEDLLAKSASELGGKFNQRMRDIITLLTKDFAPDAVNIVLGHVTIAGSELGGGERTAQTIFDYWIDPIAFPTTAHYVALGHIHKMQQMPGPSPIHYCGSPLMLDFSDKDDERYVLLVEASAGVPATVEPRALTSGTRLRTLRGTLADLKALEGTTGDAHLRIFVKEKAYATLGDEVREMFPTAVKVIIDSEPDANSPRRVVDRSTASPHELFTTYLAEREIEDPLMVTLFDELYEDCS